MSHLPARLLLLLLLLAPGARGAWLEGIRWFRHDDFVRVVFDLSAPTAYRVSEQLASGYVDLILQGDLTPRIAGEIPIGEPGVLEAKQLRKTSTSLTWRIKTRDVARVRHMSVDEQPFKVALDFYGAPPSGKPRPGARDKAASADGQAAAPARAADKPPARLVGKSGHAGAPAAGSVGESPVRVAAGRGDPSAPDQRYEGLKPDDRRRLLVGELLLQLGDSAGALAYLEQVSSQQPTHPWTRFLLAQTALSKGDEFRAGQLLEPLRAQERWKSLLDPLLKRLHLPDEKGLVPGGDIPEEDLSYYINVLKAGAGLSTIDIYHKPAPAQRAFDFRMLLPGLVLGAVLGLLAFGIAELRRRRQVDQMVRDRIMASDSPRMSSPFADQGDRTDYVDVSRRVREELEQVMQSEHEESRPPAPGHPASRTERDPFGEEFTAGSGSGGDTLEEKVYRLADQKKSIVEIAEELNLGVDEVRLHLELREQAGRIANA